MMFKNILREYRKQLGLSTVAFTTENEGLNMAPIGSITLFLILLSIFLLILES